jgi:AcrR family transcriptional regulator
MVKHSGTRPGGRSRRVREAVFAAVEDLLTESPGELPPLAVIAARAGVNPTSLYRRWRDARTLAGEVAVARLMRELPVPDTGSVRGDLVGWAVSTALSLATPGDVALLRILTAAPRPEGNVSNLHDLPIGPRVAELEAMLARGAARGERVPTIGDVLEIVLAPLYLRAFFIGPFDSTEGIERLVDRLLDLSPVPAPKHP